MGKIGIILLFFGFLLLIINILMFIFVDTPLTFVIFILSILLNVIGLNLIIFSKKL